MKVLIRTDASARIGTGHVMRCLTLAERLAAREVDVHFVARHMPEHLDSLIRGRGFGLTMLPTPHNAAIADAENPYARWLGVDQTVDAEQTASVVERRSWRPDWLVVDHYGIDFRWHQLVRPGVDKIMVIDDLANRRLACDLLLDQNYYPEGEKRYRRLVPAACRLLTGPEHALLRPEFYDVVPRRKSAAVRRILVFFGGCDLSGQTLKALDAIEALNNDRLEVDVVVGAGNPRLKQIESRCERSQRIHLHCQTSQMAELMKRADLSLGAGGTTIYERLYTKLPTIAVAVADNQTEVLSALAADGYLVHLGRDDDVTAEDMSAATAAYLDRKLEINEYEFPARSDILWRRLQAAADAEPASAGAADCL